jgi:transposase InsO family protein
MAKVAAGPSAAKWDEALIVDEMYDVHAHHDDTYGSLRMTTELRRRGYCVNHKRTERLMAENGIVASDGRRRRVRTTIPDVTAPPLPDLVRRDFSVGELRRRTCGDIQCRRRHWMSHDHTTSGRSATSSGFTRAGCVA